MGRDCVGARRKLSRAGARRPCAAAADSASTPGAPSCRRLPPGVPAPGQQLGRLVRRLFAIGGIGLASLRPDPSSESPARPAHAARPGGRGGTAHEI